MNKTPSIPFKILLIILALFLCCQAGNLTARGVKTSYKQYSIYKYQDRDILCEPYVVQKDDWLYKIFRQKGEISEKDFPKFINIFKKINPTISNVDAIAPGINILIPLKEVIKEEYDQSSPGNVEIPVVEFSAMTELPELKEFMEKRTVKKGETISELIDKEFLQKDGRLSEEGLKAFQLANPDIKNINIIYEGQDVYLPSPDIKSQPWFTPFFKDVLPPPGPEAEKKPFARMQNAMDAYELAQIKKYSALIGGTLLNQGEMYFPGENNTGTVVDLSKNPVIETKDGKKIFILSDNDINSELLSYMKNHWKSVKVSYISETVDKIKKFKKETEKKKFNISTEYSKTVRRILKSTRYDYIPDAKIPFTLNNITLEATFGRIIRIDDKDILINFGNVYGSVLDVLEKKEFQIISLTPQMTPIDIAQKIFSALGYTTWENPSFVDQGMIQTLNGLYAARQEEKLFIGMTRPDEESRLYLEKEDVKIISIENPPD